VTDRSSLEDGRPESGEPSPLHDQVSPVTGEVLERVRLATHGEIAEAACRLAERPCAAPDAHIFAFFRRLKDELVSRRGEFVRLTTAETGFIVRDAEETVDAAIDFLGSFETYVERQPRPEYVFHHSYSSGSGRSMRLTSRPYGLIAALVPQNASLTLGITIIASALYAGSRVLLRPSLQTASTGALLAESVAASDPPDSRVEIVNSLASTFLDACCGSEHVEVVHYIGSNRHAPAVLNQTFLAGKLCLLDGQGNGLLYVDETHPFEDSVRLITDAATRFNGETCTSVNGVLVEQALYPRLRDALAASFDSLVLGDPFAPETHVGPLFSEHQAQFVRQLVSGGDARVVAGGTAKGAYFRPTVVEGIRPDSLVVREGLFGPAVWIQPVRWSDLPRWIRSNWFPLSDTVLSARRDVIRKFAGVTRAPRVCVNADPSVESMFEPWGGYPPGSLNPVSPWVQKYRQSYQLDGHLDEIASAVHDPGPVV
jgi:acyl-CoA reductase-like NAD-dependent aldehyde dehydrogenase